MRRALPRESKIVHNRVHFDPLGDVRAAEKLGSGFLLVGLQPTWVYRPGVTFGYPADAKADWPR